MRGCGGTSKMKTIIFGQWAKLYRCAATKQGWSLFDADGIITIQKIDDPEEHDAAFLDSDAAAVEKVFAGAATGDRACLLALFLDGKPAKHKYSVPLIPNLADRLLSAVVNLSSPEHT